MIRLRQFEPTDIDAISPTAIDDSPVSRAEYTKHWAEFNAKAGPAYTGYYNNVIVGAMGIRLFNEHSGVLWAVFADAMKSCVKSTLRSSREILIRLIEEFDLQTIFATSRKGFGGSQRLLEHLGFTKMKKETVTHYYYKLEV